MAITRSHSRPRGAMVTTRSLSRRRVATRSHSRRRAVSDDTGASRFVYDLFADLGLPYQAYVPPPDETFSEDEWDAPEPAPVARPREEPTREGSSAARRRRAVARGKRPVGEPVIPPDEGGYS